MSKLRCLLGTVMLLGLTSCQTEPPGRGAMYGKHAPEFQIEGVYGERYSPSALKGNVVLLQFGASW